VQTNGETVERRLLIDTDPGADDAIAILLALRTPGVEVTAITTVAGNIGLDQTTRNALKILEVAGRRDIPVHRGAAVALAAGVIESAANVHGDDGMGDHDFEPVGEPHEASALDATLALLERDAPSITWVTLGPLTNVAHAVQEQPELCRRVGRLVVMGGTSDGVGNVTPAAEFNFWADPEAARVVLNAGLPVQLVGWDVSRRDALVGPSDLARLRASNDPVAQFAVQVSRRYLDHSGSVGTRGSMDLPDAAAMFATLEPADTRWRSIAVDVECRGELTRGAMVVDHWGTTGARPNVDLCTGIPPEAFRAVLVERLTSGS
jgi:purine nucleosidase